MIALVSIVGGMLAGLLSGGTLWGLREVKLRHEAVVIALFVAQGIARGRIVGAAASPASFWVWCACSCVLAVLLVMSWGHAGVALIVVGTLLNLDVVLLGHGMPVLPPSQGPMGAVAAATSQTGGFYHVAGGASLGLWASDVMPLPLLGHLYLLSAGDVMLGVGVAVLISSAMLSTAKSAGIPSREVSR